MACKPDLNVMVQLVAASCALHPPGGEPLSAGPLTLNIQKGEFLSILGPAGCGKGTLLRMMAGLLQPTSGEVRVEGGKLDGPYNNLGFVFKDPSLMPWKTALGNILFQAELRGLDVANARHRATRLLEAMGISNLENSYPAGLSTENAHRVAVCRALVLDPSLLLMDDWLISLDPMRREQISIDLQRLITGSGLTTVLATTSIHEAVQLSDRIAILSWGARLLKLRAVELPRPRRMDKLTTPRIAEYCSEIRMLFHAEGIFA